MRELRAGTMTAIILIAMLGTVAPAGAIPPDAPAGPTVVLWSATHGDATASGGRWLELPNGSLSIDLVAEGEL